MTDTLYAECQNQIDRCKNARDELSRISEGITHAANHVDQAANWWIEVETSLGTISDNVQSIQENRPANLRLRDIQKNWDVIRGRYLEYRSEVRSL
jgi:hypothetical protein